MRYIGILLIAIIITSCSNEFELNEPKKEVPVVYAVLDPGDENQYFRIERVFLDPEKSANEVAQNPDSLYYDDISVKLIDKSTSEQFLLEKVDGTDEGFPRGDGIFANSPNILYKLANEELDIEFPKNTEYDLVIDGIFEDRSVTASTIMIERPGVSTPFSGGNIKFSEGKTTTIGWSSRDGNELFSATIFLKIKEIPIQGQGPARDKILEWNIAKSTSENSLKIDGVEFYQYLGAVLEADPNIESRFLLNASYHLTAGNSTLADINRVAKANLGITSSGEVPVFTNISEGLGIFGAKYTVKVNDINITFDTRDSLTQGRFTKDLNFE